MENNPQDVKLSGARKIIEHFNMRPLPDEGGWYVETYRSKEILPLSALPGRYLSQRCFATHILYLITDTNCSKMHRVSSDELFHFYLGDPVKMVQIGHEAGTYMLGPDIFNGQVPQVTVAAGTWQGCYIPGNGKWALLGCTVSPGFEFKDYDTAGREKLFKENPDFQADLSHLL